MLKHKKLWIIVLVVACLTCVGYVYVNTYYCANTVAEDAMVSDSMVRVDDQEDWIAFVPEKYEMGIILYPGAKVESEAYAPLCKRYAQAGVLSAVAKVPFHIAFFAQNIADEIKSAYVCKNWYIGGHSLGGVVAGNYFKEHQDGLEGLVLLASYTTADFSGTDAKMIYVEASNDLVLNKKSYEKNMKNASNESYAITIQGGNHAQFGSYGKQKGDGDATISPQKQWDTCVEETVKLMGEVK